jgi:hypothetical protein
MRSIVSQGLEKEGREPGVVHEAEGPGHVHECDLDPESPQMVFQQAHHVVVDAAVDDEPVAGIASDVKPWAPATVLVASVTLRRP